MKYANKISAMKAVDETTQSVNLAWAVLSKNQATGRSDVIKITGHEEADAFVQNNPDLYYKSGPFVVWHLRLSTGLSKPRLLLYRCWKNLMKAAAISSWVVLIYHIDQDAHAAHFPSFDKAEDFANDLRIASTLCVSEPMPVTPVDDIRLAIWRAFKSQEEHAILCVACFFMSWQ